MGSLMANRGRGKIINIASIAGLIGRDRPMYQRNTVRGQPVDYAAACAFTGFAELPSTFSRGAALFHQQNRTPVALVGHRAFALGSTPSAKCDDKST